MQRWDFCFSINIYQGICHTRQLMEKTVLWVPFKFWMSWKLCDFFILPNLLLNFLHFSLVIKFSIPLYSQCLPIYQFIERYRNVFVQPHSGLMYEIWTKAKNMRRYTQNLGGYIKTWYFWIFSSFIMIFGLSIDFWLIYQDCPNFSAVKAQLVELCSCNWVVAVTCWTCTWTSGSLFRSNGEEDQNVPLKDFNETKMGCQECRGKMGGWSDLVWIVYG